MILEELLLKKQEIPIVAKRIYIEAPIHHMLLTEELDSGLASSCFPQAAEEWIVDLRLQLQELRDGDERRWMRREYLDKAKFPLKKHNGRYGFLGIWNEEVFCAENGFATTLGISRNAGGALYYQESACAWPIDPKERQPHIHLTPRKLRNYADEQDGYHVLHKYLQHNVDTIAGAVFLRNWAVLYLNAALASVLK